MSTLLTKRSIALAICSHLRASTPLTAQHVALLQAFSSEPHIHFDADQDTLREVIGRNVAPADSAGASTEQAVLTTHREALSLYRDILRKSRVFTWESKPGETWRETLCASTRAEFELYRHELDPHRVTSMLLAGRDALDKTLEKVKHENFDQYLRELDVPWVVRKAAIKYGSKSCDLIQHAGEVMTTVTVNAKGSWSRQSDCSRELQQRYLDGRPCKVKSWWEGSTHKTRYTCSGEGVLRASEFEAHTYMEGGMMVVKNLVRSERGRETAVYWFLEASIEPASTSTGRPLAQQIARDQRRVQRATAKDNAYLKFLTSNMAQWHTPADEYMSGRHHGEKAEVLSRSTSPRSHSSAALRSPLSISPRPSVQLARGSSAGIPRGLPPPHPSSVDTDVVSSGELGRDDDSSRVSRPGLRSAASEEAAAVALSAAGDPPPQPHSLQGPQHGRSSSWASSGGANAGSSLVSTQGGLGGAAGGVAPARRSYAGLSDFSDVKSQGSLDDPLGHKLQEFTENRSVTSVIPLHQPLTTNEPELLEMSPEQAEATQLKMSELEKELRLAVAQRHKAEDGHPVLCCTFIFHNKVIPPYLRGERREAGAPSRQQDVSLLQRLGVASAGLLLGAQLLHTGAAQARLEGVNNPKLLPSAFTRVIDVAGFLTEGEEARLSKELENLEADTGVKLRVLAQNYPNTPGLAIKDFWGVDEDTVVFVADPSLGNILNFNVGGNLDLKVPRNFWTRLAGKYGSKFYWQESGEGASIINSVSAIDTCLREPPGRFQCSKIQEPLDKAL